MKAEMMQRALWAMLLCGLCLCPGFGQTSPEANQVPVQAELLSYINVRHLTDGATVTARTTADWSGTGCVLRRGAILEVKVETASPRGKGGHSKLALSFTKAQCNGADMVPFSLVLEAIAATPTLYSNVTTGPTIPIGSFSNPNGHGSVAGFGGAGMGDLTVTHLEFMGVQHSFPMRPELRSGDVIDLKGLKLEVGSGPNQSSVLTSKDRDVSLGKYTQFLLMPASLAFRPEGASPVTLHTRNPADPSQPSIPPSPHPAAFVDSLETCAPPGCAVDLPVTSAELTGHAGDSIPVRALGYAPRTNKVMDSFDHEDALAWLGPQELLLAMNPHTLIRRNRDSKKGAPVRVIRAVLLDTGSRAVLQAVDWELADYGRYLWQLDRNRILVHVGNELRVYGSGLKVESRIPLSGPLAFVRIAPNGQLMAVATLRERHSEELHSRLLQESDAQPEEDVDVLILDQGFKTIGETSTTSGLMPPTLLNEGQVKLLAQPKDRYRLAMSTWDNKTVTLARFGSLCTPHLSSVAPDLLFLMTCNVTDGATEYRVLRGDGKPLLRGKASPTEVGQDAIGNNQNQTFAVKVVHANRALSSGGQFRGLELESEQVRVYRASDGKRLLSVKVDDPGTSQGGYALSADGSRLAVLAGSEIRLFPVPAQ